MKRELFLVTLGIILSIYLISSHVVTPSSGTSFSVNPNESFPYTITVNNTDEGQDANVTQVNITLPSSFTFIEGSNITTASFETFINDSNVLSWTNSSSEGYLINGSDTEDFQFSANAPTLGDYNLTITVVNLTGSFNYNISVTIADVSDPSITFDSSTPDNNAVLNQTNILLEVSATDNIATDTITGFIYNSTRSLLTSSTTTNNSLSVNFTGLVDGDYYINATVNDTSGNNGSTSTRKITVNTSAASSAPAACTENWNCTEWSVCSNNLQVRSCADSNACNSSFLTKNENQTCGTTCTPNWDCTDWVPEECTFGENQNRTCTDLNNCGLTKPIETLVCEEEKGSKFWVITILLIIVGILFLGGVIFFLKGRSLGEPSLYDGGNKKIPPSGSLTQLYNYSRRPTIPTRIPRPIRRPMMRKPNRMAQKPPRINQKRGNFQNKPL